MVNTTGTRPVPVDWSFALIGNDLRLTRLEIRIQDITATGASLALKAGMNAGGKRCMVKIVLTHYEMLNGGVAFCLKLCDRLSKVEPRDSAAEVEACSVCVTG